MGVSSTMTSTREHTHFATDEKRAIPPLTVVRTKRRTCLVFGNAFSSEAIALFALSFSADNVSGRLAEPTSGTIGVIIPTHT